MDDSASRRTEVLIVGAGPAAHAFLLRFLRDPRDDVRITVIGDEARSPYDRSQLFRLLRDPGSEEADLDRAVFRDDRVRLERDDRVRKIEIAARVVRTRSGRAYSYDLLILATGAHPVRPTISGAGLPGVFSSHSAADARALHAYRTTRRGRRTHVTVVGDGAVAFAAALALHDGDVEVTVVRERADEARLSRPASETLDRLLRDRGVAVRTSARVTRLDANGSGAVGSVEFHDGTFIKTDAVVFSPEPRARDELARNAGLSLAPGGGVLVDADGRTSDPRILAIGAVAVAAEEAQAERAPVPDIDAVTSARICGAAATSQEQLGATVVSAGDIEVAQLSHTSEREVGGIVVALSRGRGLFHGELVLSDDGRALLGVTLIGEPGTSMPLLSARNDAARARAARELLRVGRDADGCGHGLAELLRRKPEETTDRAGTTLTDALGRFPESSGCAACARAVAEQWVARAGGLLAGVPWSVGAVNRVATRPLAVENRGAVTVSAPEELSGAQLIHLGRLAEELGASVSLDGGGRRLELRGVRAGDVPLVRSRLRTAGLDATAQPTTLRFGESDAATATRRVESPA